MNMIHLLEAQEPWSWSSAAAGIIFETLKNSDADLADRCLAANLGSEEVVMNDDLADLMLTIHADKKEPESLRCVVAIALGVPLAVIDLEGFDDDDEFGDDEDDDDNPCISSAAFARVWQQLKHCFEDESAPLELRRKSLEAAVRCSQDWHVDAIRWALLQDHPDWRLTAIFAAGYVRGFEADIIAALDDDNIYTQVAAIRGAGALGLRKAWPALKPILEAGNPGESDKSRYDRYLTAVEALPGVAPKKAANELLTKLQDDGDETVAYAAADAMIMAGFTTDDFSDGF